MLVIRTAQTKAFEDASYRDFIHRMTKHLLETFPDESTQLSQEAGPAAIPSFIEETIQLGRRWGLTSERAVAGLLNLTMVYGRNFELGPEMDWTIDILEDAEMDGQAKIDLIFRLLPEE